MRPEDVIFALATPPGRSAIAVLRVSGAEAHAVLERLFVSANGKESFPPKPRRLYRGFLKDPTLNVLMDEVLLCRFQAPNSYTGEEVYEIYCHGNPIIVREIYGLLSREGARVAEPGEFTRRAYLNGKLDLIQVEAIGELLQARSAKALSALRSQYDGRFSAKVSALRERLLAALAWIEADIDFGDREVDDVVPVDNLDLSKIFAEFMADADDLLKGVTASGFLRGGLNLVFVGRPNVGKSSLFNELSGDSRAIVDPLPGTTRDYLEASLELAGLACRLVDTAGLHSVGATEPLEAEGVRRARHWLTKAHVVLAVFDQSQKLDSEDEAMIRELEECGARDQRLLLIFNKTDLPASSSMIERMESMKMGLGPVECLQVSARSGEGVALLRKSLEARVKRIFAAEESINEEDACFLSERQTELLRQVHDNLKAVAAAIAAGRGLECLTQDLRDAVSAVSRLLGRDIPAGDTLQEREEILDRVFSAFCIGK